MAVAAAFALCGAMVDQSYGQGEVYCCIRNKTGKIRVVADPASCKAGKATAIAWNTPAYVGSLEAHAAAMETRAAAMESQSAAMAQQVAAMESQAAALESLLAHFSRDGNDAYVTGANLHILSGSGSTYAAPPNGLGNLIVGYNELRDGGDNRTGAHNIVVGRENNYSSYGGLVAGWYNNISGPYASVSGGIWNTASGEGFSVNGGYQCTAAGAYDWAAGGLWQDQ